MEFWHWIIFLIAHNEDPINGDRQTIDISWYDVVVFVQTFIMIKWDGILVERNALVGAISQVSGTYRGVAEKLMFSPQMSMFYSLESVNMSYYSANGS